jgi:hypothetical protein
MMTRSNSFFITPNLQAKKDCSVYLKMLDPMKVKKEGTKELSKEKSFRIYFGICSNLADAETSSA